MAKDPNKEKELIDLIRQGKALGEEITQKTRYRNKESQFIVDLADESLEVIKYGLPPNIDVNPILNSWRYAILQEGEILNNLDSMPVTTSGTAIAFSSTGLANPNDIIPFVPSDKRSEVSFHVDRLSQIIDRKAKRENVLVLLSELNLNPEVPNLQKPEELFKSAWEAFEGPVTCPFPANTSLIPMRECIDRVIVVLLQRRPEQEPAKNIVQKIQSILNQLAHNGTPQSAINDLANRWHGLNNELSSSKQRPMSRQECMDTLRRSTLFLFELLQSIDKSKMK